MRSPLRRSAGTRRSSPYPSTAGMRLRSPCGGWMPCGATVRRPWWSCSTAIAPTNMPRASWPISWRRGDSCPWLRPLSSASTPTPRRVGRSLRGGPTGTTAPEAEAFGRVVAAKLAAGGVRAIDAKRLPTVRNGMLDVAVRAVRTRLPPQSEAASATGGGRDLGRQVHALRPLCETLPDGSHRRRRRASYRCGEVYPLLCLRQGMSRRRTQLRFSLRTRAVA